MTLHGKEEMIRKSTLKQYNYTPLCSEKHSKQEHGGPLDQEK